MTFFRRNSVWSYLGVGIIVGLFLSFMNSSITGSDLKTIQLQTTDNAANRRKFIYTHNDGHQRLFNISTDTLTESSKARDTESRPVAGDNKHFLPLQAIYKNIGDYLTDHIKHSTHKNSGENKKTEDALECDDIQFYNPVSEACTLAL